MISLTPELKRTLALLGYLGFDSMAQAAGAILAHDDWADRFDLLYSLTDAEGHDVIARWRADALTQYTQATIDRSNDR